MIVIVLLSLTLGLVVMSNLFLSWNLARQGKKKLMYIMIVATVTAAIYYTIRIVILYNTFKFL